MRRTTLMTEQDVRTGERRKMVMEVEGMQQADAVLKHIAGGFGEGRARGASSIGTA